MAMPCSEPLFTPGSSSGIARIGATVPASGIASIALFVFASVVAPELLCPDKRNGVINLYLVRPFTGSDYIVARWLAFLGVDLRLYSSLTRQYYELRRELQVIIQEARRKLDNPGAVAQESLFETMFDVHRIRRWRPPSLRSNRWPPYPAYRCWWWKR